ncbi:MAG: dehydrogenase, partial [Candidatus Methanomethylophilaceae archaeon]|nr:dehydrogenase [Candidatus Methanomethylophilaceae archaeon]
QRTLFGRETTKIDLSHVHDVSKAEGFALAVLCVIIALFGIWPDFALGYIETFVANFAIPGV